MFSALATLMEKIPVSPYAFLVRLQQLGRITQQQYDTFEGALRDEYKKQQGEWRKKGNGGPSRNRTQETRTQFGNPFVNTVLTAWHYKELSVLKAVYLLNLKRPAQLYDLDKSG